MRALLLAALTAASLASPAFAQDTIEVSDPYARSSNPKAGAAFMTIRNSGDTEDRLVAVRSGAAEQVQLHTSLEEDGVMRMVELEDGIAVPAGGEVRLQRGGDHVMFMGLAEPFEEGASLEVTLVFEQAGDVTVVVPVDQERMPEMDGSGG